MDNDTSNTVNNGNNGNNGHGFIRDGQGEREDRGDRGNGGFGGGSTVTVVPRLNLTGGEITTSSSSSSFDPILEREIRSSWEKYRHYVTEGTPEGDGTVAPMNQK